MEKPDLRKTALKLYNQGAIGAYDVFEYEGLSDNDACECLDYIDEIIRSGKTEFKKKYCI